MPIFPDVVSSVPAKNPEQITQRHQTLSSPGWGGQQQFKSKLPFPLRDVTLRYANISLPQAQALWQFHLDMKGSFRAFNYFADLRNADGSWLTWTKEYVGKGDGSRAQWTIPGRDVQGVEVLIIAIDSNSLLGNGYIWTKPFTVTPRAGLDGADLLSFPGEKPPAGSTIWVTFTGRLAIRCRFAEDQFEWSTFYRRLVSTGVRLKGLAMN